MNEVFLNLCGKPYIYNYRNDGNFLYQLLVLLWLPLFNTAILPQKALPPQLHYQYIAISISSIFHTQWPQSARKVAR